MLISVCQLMLAYVTLSFLYGVPVLTGQNELKVADDTAVSLVADSTVEEGEGIGNIRISLLSQYNI